LSSPSQTQSQNSIPASAPASSSSNSSATPQPSAAQTQAAKQAFLAPFELFYDALHDARQLKVWLNEQLTRTAALTRRWEDEVAKLEKEREDRNNTTTLVKREEVDGPMSLSVGVNVELREELERLRRRVDELEGRLGSAAVATTTASSSSSTSSHSSHEGYTFPQKQPPQKREREQHQDQQPPPLPQSQRDQPPVTTVTAAAATASLAVKPLPAISRRLSLSGRPELGRRLSSPGWHPSSSIRGSAYRAVGREGMDERDDRNGHGMVGMSVSKSLSGPGTRGGGFAGGSRRRVSISGGVVPSGVKDKDGESLGEGPEQLGRDSGTKGRERAEREGTEAMEGREERHGEDEGGMNVDSVGEGGGEGEQDRNREEEKDKGREESRR
jgi:BMFP domain-containing protein YqiC